MTDSISTAGSTPLEFKFSQVFGERAPGEAIRDEDLITAIEFDKRGDYLAVGDRGGRIVIFERDNDNKDTASHYRSRKELEQLDVAVVYTPRFRYKTEFQSHEPEFDYLKSVEIEERIKKLRWCSTQNGSLSILSANDKTIKMYKIKEHKVKKVKEPVNLPMVSSENVLLAERSYVSEQETLSIANGFHSEWMEMANDLSLSENIHAKIAVGEDTSSTRCRKVYAHAHDFNINSISNNSDGETFVSADDLRINLWNLEINDQCFNIIDLKPSNMEDLTEVITSAEFHPTHCNLLAYSSSRGFIYLTDMRQAALCDNGARILHGELRGPKSFFTEIVASISDLKFLNDGRHLISRDYMNLKLWDMHMDSAPVAIFKIHEHLRPKLSELYNNDSIFDKFECCASGDGLHFATGSYSNLLRLFSRGVQNDEGITIEASRTPTRKTTQIAAPRARRSSLSNLTRGFYRHGNDDNISGSNLFPCDSNAKLLHVTWHPTTTLIACAAGNSLLLYHA